MSYDTHKTWFYQISGRDLQLWQLVDSGNIEVLAGYKILLPGEYYGRALIYPNEDISDGLRIEYAALNEPFVSEALEDTTARYSASGISFTASSKVIATGVSGAWSTAGFAAGDMIRVIGSASNDGDYTIASFSGSGSPDAVVSESLTDESSGESITIYQIPKEASTPDESSHVNLNRMLSLAVVSYVRAMQSELSGDLQGKEYYMREFWKKVGDNESNKKKTMMSFPSSPYAVR